MKDVKNVGDYIITDFMLGSGSFAKVFLCYMKDSPNTYYAAKQFPIEELKSNQEFSVYVEREISTLKKLRHNNIMRLYDVLKTKLHWYLILEFCDADTLDDLLERYGEMFNTKLSTKLIKHFASQLGRGLEYIHSIGYIHRDIKLDNIMISFTQEALQLIKKKYKQVDDMFFSFNKSNVSLDLERNNLSLNLSVSIKSTSCKRKKYFYYEEPFCKDKEIFEEVMLMSTLKIIDLGLANNVDVNGCAGTLCGNYDTLSPEFVDITCHNKIGAKYDSSIDIWSYGYILYYLIDIKYPFTLSEDYYEDLKEDFERGNYYLSHSSSLTYELLELLSRLLRKDAISRITAKNILNHKFINTPAKNQEVIRLEDIKSEYVFNNQISLNINKSLNLSDLISDKAPIKKDKPHYMERKYYIMLDNSKDILKEDKNEVKDPKESNVIKPTETKSKEKKKSKDNSKDIKEIKEIQADTQEVKKDEKKREISSIYEEPQMSNDSLQIVQKVNSEFDNMKSMKIYDDQFGYTHIDI